MRHVVLAFLIALMATAGLSAPAEARGHVVVGIGLGLGGWGYPGYYGYPGSYGYPAYYPSYYPSAVYQAPPTVVYAQPPAQTYYVQPQPQPMPQPQAYGQIPLDQPAQQPPYLSATQTSNTFVDERGRSCRMFQSEMDGAPVSGKACVLPDGSWRTAE